MKNSIVFPVFLLFVVQVYSSPFKVGIIQSNKSSFTYQQVSNPFQDSSKISMDEAQRHVISLAAALSTGTDGVVGLDAVANVLPWLSTKLGFNFMKIGASGDFNGQDFGFEANKPFEIEADVNLTVLDLLVEFTPTKKNNFRIVSGLGFGFNNSIDVKGQFTEGIELDDYVVPADRVGHLRGTYTTSSSVYPYIGIGFGRSIPKKRLNFSFDMGTYYRGAPQIKISGTNMLEENEHNGPILEENLSSLRWHPVINFRLGIRIYDFQKKSKTKEVPEDKI